MLSFKQILQSYENQQQAKEAKDSYDTDDNSFLFSKIMKRRGPETMQHYE